MFIQQKKIIIVFYSINDESPLFLMLIGEQKVILLIKLYNEYEIRQQIQVIQVEFYNLIYILFFLFRWLLFIFLILYWSKFWLRKSGVFNKYIKIQCKRKLSLRCVGLPDLSPNDDEYFFINNFNVFYSHWL